MEVTVDELLNVPFLNRSREEKERIVLEGKPRPFLQNLHSVDNLPSCSSQMDMNNGVNKYLIFFDVSTYDHVEWMTGCDVRQALFCWSCLLFTVQKNVWNTTGLTYLSQLQENIKFHEKSVLHIQGMLDLHLFTERIKTEKPRDSKTNHDSELIKRNREIVRRIVDVVCFLVTQQQPPRTATTDKNKLQIEDCLENLQFLRDYDILQASLIDDATDMLQISPNLVTDVIGAICSFVKTSIQRETSQSAYVSLILSEHSEDPLKSQLSTVLRYLKDGEVFERFIGFTNSEGYKSASQIFELMNKVITEFQISRRMIAYSVDGFVFNSLAVLDELKRDLKFRHPFAYFVPCHFHKLDRILQQSLSFIQDCDYFFKNLTALSSFFHEEPKMFQDLQRFKTGEIPTDIDILNSTNYVEFFNTIKSFRPCLIEFFNHTINNPENVTSNNLMKIIGLQTFLTDMKTVFLIEAFLRLFGVVSPLSVASENKIPFMAFDSNLIDCVLQTLQYELECGEFDSLWKETIVEFEEIRESQASTDAGNKNKQCKKLTCQKLYIDLARCMTHQIRCRFENAKKLEIFRIFNSKESRKNLEPETLQNLSSAYGKCFNSTQLSKEIILLNKNKESINADSVQQLLRFFITTGVSRSFENLLQLSEISLTMPCTPPSINGYSSKLHEINVWSYSLGKYEITGDLSLLCIEKDYLRELRKKITFYDEVIYKFQEINKTIELLNA